MDMNLFELIGDEERKDYERERGSLYGADRKLMFDILCYVLALNGRGLGSLSKSHIKQLHKMKKHLLGNGYLTGVQLARSHEFWRDLTVNIAFRLPTIPPNFKLSNTIFESLQRKLERIAKKYLNDAGFTIVFHGYLGFPSDEFQGFHFHVHFAPFRFEACKRNFVKNRSATLKTIAKTKGNTSNDDHGIVKWMDNVRIREDEIQESLRVLNKEWSSVVQKHFTLSRFSSTKPLVTIGEGARRWNPLERDVADLAGLFEYHHQLPPDRIRRRYRFSFDANIGTITYWKARDEGDSTESRMIRVEEFVRRCFLPRLKVRAKSIGVMRSSHFSRMLFDWYFTAKYFREGRYLTLDWATRPCGALSAELGRDEAKRLMRAIEEVKRKMAATKKDKRYRWLSLFKRTFKLALYYLEFHAKMILNNQKRRINPTPPKPPPYRRRFPLREIKKAAMKDAEFNKMAPPEAKRLLAEAKNHQDRLRNKTRPISNLRHETIR